MRVTFTPAELQLKRQARPGRERQLVDRLLEEFGPMAIRALCLHCGVEIADGLARHGATYCHDCAPPSRAAA